MPAVLSRWELRDVDQARDWGLAALQFCRVQRGRDEVESSRYWLSTATEIAILTQLAPDSPPTLGQGPEVARSLADLMVVARNTSNETWSDARAASDTFTEAGR